MPDMFEPHSTGDISFGCTLGGLIGVLMAAAIIFGGFKFIQYLTHISNQALILWLAGSIIFMAVGMGLMVLHDTKDIRRK